MILEPVHMELQRQVEVSEPVEPGTGTIRMLVMMR
jgi:hypothetical protein